jgi:hypothetical protein
MAKYFIDQNGRADGAFNGLRAEYQRAQLLELLRSSLMARIESG